MLARRIIPYVEVSEGRTVTTPATDSKTADDPAELARFYEAGGADELMFYDHTVTSDRSNFMEELIARVNRQVFLPTIIGGGIEAKAQIRSLLRAGADRVILDDGAVKRPDFITEAVQLVGSDRVILGMSVRRKRTSEVGDGKSAGTATAEPVIGANSVAAGYEVVFGVGGKTSGRDAIAWVQEAESRGVGEILVNCLDRVGQREGFDLALIAQIAEAVSVPVIAAGGAGTPAHFVELFRSTRVAGAIASGIFHVRESSIKRIKRDCLDAHIAVRPFAVDAVEPEKTPGTVASGELPVQTADVPTPPGPTRPGQVGGRP